MKGARSPRNNDTPGRRGPYAPNEPGVSRSSLILGLGGLWRRMVVLSGRAVVDGNPPGFVCLFGAPYSHMNQLEGNRIVYINYSDYKCHGNDTFLLAIGYNPSILLSRNSSSFLSFGLWRYLLFLGWGGAAMAMTGVC